MRKILSYALIIVSAAAIGTGAGFVSKKLFGPTEEDLSGINFDSFKVDAAQIVRKIDSYNGTKDVTENFTTGEILNYSMEKFRRCENCCSFTFGVADTIVKQDIRACLIKNGDNYFEESVSKSSMVSLANRMMQNGIDSNVSFYSANKGSINILENGASGEYTESEVKTFTSNDYRDIYGKTLDEMFIYSISDQTIVESNINKNDNGYVISVSLDPNLSTNAYKHQMLNISGLDKLPKFENVNLTFTLDKDLRIKKLSIDENYIATMVVDAKTHGMVDIYYYADEYIKIPGLNESVEYKKGE